MTNLINRAQSRTEELLEFAMTGPFGGIQSELPPTEIEMYGFVDTKNTLFKTGIAYSRPGYTVLAPFPSPANEPIMGVADFYTIAGNHIQCVFTPTRLLQWNGSGWTNITGPGFTGTSTQLFAWDIVNYKLCFSQGADIVWLWDGISSSYVQSSVNAVAALHMSEIAQHLMLANTLESGTQYPQRYRWSAIDDPTTWNSFDSGVNDILNNLGPVNGIIKLGQYGFGGHEQGWVQIIPTGIGLDPFEFFAIINASQGLTCPYSLDHFDDQGVEYAAYVGPDNVYTFNGTSVSPIGDQPIGDRKRLGARSRIMADIRSSNPNTVYGFVTYAINGIPFRAYWLVVPGVSVWVYNFDEQNWTYFTYSTQLVSIGVFYAQAGIRIIDLIGTIAQQNWTPASLVGSNPFNGFLLGFNNGTAGYVDFTNYSELGCSITGPSHIFGDRRHKHSVKKFRLAVYDKGPVTYTLTLSNESGFSQTQSVTIGTGSGQVLQAVLTFNISGLRINWTVSAPASQPAAFVEFAPIFDISGEQRGGSADNN
jgi:hypothetical protein